MGRITFQYLDFDGDRAQVSVNAKDGTAGTYTADVAEITALISALNAITLGNLVFHAWEAVRTETGAVQPTDPAAQANYQAVAVSVEDSSGETFNTRIPTPDHSLFTEIIGGKASMDLSTGAGATLKAAWEDAVRGPNDNTVVLSQVYLRE